MLRGLDGDFTTKHDHAILEGILDGPVDDIIRAFGEYLVVPDDEQECHNTAEAHQDENPNGGYEDFGHD